jgi:tetratricopeptide (TPR) repeat protein
LLCLAPFSSFIDRSDLPNYEKQLQRLEPFKDFDFAGFDEAVQEAIDWGLLSLTDAGSDNLLSIQPVFPYFLQMRLNESTNEIQSALQDGFKNHYRGLAYSYDQLMQSKDPQEKQLGTFFGRLEYENLYAALQTCLKKHESFTDIFCCLYRYFLIISDKQGMLKIAEDVNEVLETYPTELIQGELGHEAMIALDYLANAYLETKQFNRAKQSYQKKLEVIAALQSIEARQKGLSTANTYHSLGRVAQELREWDDARHNYHQALAIFVEFADRYAQADTYHNLGVVAQELREWDDARHNCLQALEIYVEFADRYGQAGTYHQLGTVAQELREWDDARHNYLQALEIFVEFADRYEQAGTYHQLGRVAQKLREWDDARHNYHQALAIKVEFGDRYSQASTYGQLGLLAKGEDDLEAATKNLLQALQIFVDFKDEHSIGITIRNLGHIYQSSQSPEVVTTIANICGFSESEVQQIFDAIDQGT